jgi:opacity protein-like surface antigen
MKKVFLTAAFAVAIASPALAATGHHARHNASYAEGAYGYSQPDAFTVVDAGKVLGRDPDVFIRAGLLREGDQTNTNGGN